MTLVALVADMMQLLIAYIAYNDTLQDVCINIMLLKY